MCRVLGTIALVLMLQLQSIGVEASDWSRVAKMLQASTIPIACSEHQKTTCTAFSINQDQGLYMTAFHCTVPFDEGNDVPQINGKSLNIVFADQELDLAIVRADMKRPALRYRTGVLEVGNEVASYGYGYGLDVPIFRTAVVSVFLRGTNGVEWVMFDNSLVRGQSGGPIVDRDGRVVGVNSQSDPQSGMSLSIAQIIKATQFWE